MELFQLTKGIQVHGSKLIKYHCESQNFTLFSLTLRKIHKDRNFTWIINRTSQDFVRLNNGLKTLTEYSQAVLAFPSRKILFDEKSEEKLLGLYLIYMNSVLTVVPSCLQLTEFLEVSVASFSSHEKYKEGYVYKYGSGRFTNQKRCFNFCNKVLGKKKRWLRVLPDGLEYRLSNQSHTVEEAINFCKEFKVKYGYEESGFKLGVNVLTAQHNFLFLAENVYRRDEWAESIAVSYSKSEFCVFEVRYNSSFIIREKNSAKWYIDGADYFSAIFKSLSNAKYAVCISDWWLSPDMHLKRPAALYPDSKIIDVLGRLADKGVKIYILLYKELTFTLTLNSLYTKRSFQKRSPNIKVLRHPSKSIRGGEFLWSHHSKLVCIDHSIAFLGGLDICWGRWDTQDHFLEDINGEYWPGIDYSNVRVADFVKVDRHEVESIDRQYIPRMPWHDVCVSVSGVVVKDLWSHFMQVWNHVIKDITGNKGKSKMMGLNEVSIYQRIATGIEVIVDQNSINAGKKFEFQGLVSNVILREETKEIQDIRLKFTKDRETEVDDFIDTNKKQATVKFNFMQIAKQIVTDHLTPFPEAKRTKKTPSFDEIENEELRKIMEDEDMIETSKMLDTQSDLLEIKMFKSRASKDFMLEEGCEENIECQVLRSAGRWSFGREITESSIHSAYLSLIYDAKHFIYIENQFFISCTAGKPVLNKIAQVLVKRIELAILCDEPFRVIVVLPLLPAFEGSVEDPEARVLRVQLYWEYKTIIRGKKSIYNQLLKHTTDPSKYIKFYSLRKHQLIKDRPVTEMIYVHSKLLIVDDTTVVIGSANFNDRSMVGDRDSELCLVINDSEKVDSFVDGKAFEARKFAYTFRMALFKEHSGEERDEVLQDPFSEDFYRVWDKRAIRNTKLYRKVFKCYPDDMISNLGMVREFMSEARLDKYKRAAKKIKGNLVEFPLQFLKNESLKIDVMSKEYLLPEVTFI